MNLILTAYLRSGKDGHKSWEPHRFDKREKNIDELLPLINSISNQKNYIKIGVIHDCFYGRAKDLIGANFIQHEPDDNISCNSRRWGLFLHALKGISCENVFLVDSTDVECYISPFDSDLGNFLWTGDERLNTVGSTWMKKYQEPYITMPNYKEILGPYRSHTLLNCGIVGGKRKIVLEYLELVVKYQSECSLPDNISVDMAVHNYVLFKHFKGRFKHGVQVNTVFWKNEKPNGISWFKHK